MKRNINKYNEALLLRTQGVSIRNIAKKLQISSSTASIWCRKIILTEKQREVLDNRGQNIILLKGYAEKRHVDKINRHKTIFNQAKKEIKRLNKNEVFLTGLALYWAEGFKSLKDQQVGFCNSDPRMVKFIINWFKDPLNIPQTDFVLRVELNISHENRKEEIEEYWSKLTNIPRQQFNKPYLQKTKWNRDYPNRETYQGILRIKIRRSSILLIKLLGWIEGLSFASEID